MSQSSTHALSTRLFIQAAFTAFFALTPAYTARSGWTTVAFGLAALTVAVGFLVRSAVGNARAVIIGFESLVVIVFIAGLRDHYWIPGTIFGIVTLITALSMPSRVSGCATADSAWVPPAGAVQSPAGYVAAAAAPLAGAPIIDNPYAPAVPYAVPAMGNPYAPPAPPAPVEAVLAPAPPVEDVPPAPRSMTILPGG